MGFSETNLPAEPTTIKITHHTKINGIYQYIQLTEGRGSALLDFLLTHYKLRNDAQLARFLDFQPPVISKIRHNTLYISTGMLLQIHIITGIPIKALLDIQLGNPSYTHTNNPNSTSAPFPLTKREQFAEQYVEQHDSSEALLSVVIPDQPQFFKEAMQRAHNTTTRQLQNKELRIQELTKQLDKLKAQAAQSIQQVAPFNHANPFNITNPNPQVKIDSLNNED